jgi:molybdopterin/thiamine biosynthesis adenylyltransferase
VITKINKTANNVYKPTFLRLKYDTELTTFSTLRNDFTIELHDSIETQLLELLVCRNPSLSKDEILSANMIQEHLSLHGETLHTYGVWVHYPWKRQLVHILDEEEFIEVRTNRNKYKITQEEQDSLCSKIIGIVGLSVGRTIATTIALERIAGEIRLADFDEIELSNLNRIHAPLSEMGLNKAISTAREIAEIDPYIKVTCYTEGLTAENMVSFMLSPVKIDLLVEECDEIRVKIQSRLKAKEFGIPVIMEANDGCIIDVERFDLDKSLPILHGKVKPEYYSLTDKLSLVQKTEVLRNMLDETMMSERMRESLPHLKETLVTWPQLYSDIAYGSGLLSVIVRQIFLNQYTKSARLNFPIKLDEN